MILFKDWLKDMVTERGWTQQFLASKVGVTQTAVSQWMNGIDTPRPNAVVKLAEIAGEDPIWLIRLVYQVSLPEDAKELDERMRRILKRAEQLSDDELRRLEDYIDHVAMPRVRRDKNDARKPESSEAKTGKADE